MPKNSTRRFIAKTFVSTLVWQGTAGFVNGFVTETLEVEEDSAAEAGIGLGSQVAGFVVASKLSPLTDKMVDKVADWREDRKLAKSIKKDSQEVE